MTMTSSLPLPVPDRSPLSTSVKAVVDQAIAERRLVGAVVLVSRDGRRVHRQAAAMADREAARPMQLDAIFRLAPVSKPIVSMAALLLVARGGAGAAPVGIRGSWTGLYEGMSGRLVADVRDVVYAGIGGAR